MHAYGDLLRHGAARRLMGATATGKLGFAVFPLATVLLGHGSSGSFLDAGAVAGAWSMGGTVTGPWRGRLVDRHGHRWPVLALSAVTALAAVGMASADRTWQLISFGALAGAAAPPVVASIRPLWAQFLPPELVHSAYALDAVLTEVTKVCGPLIAAAIALHSSGSGVLTAAALLVISALLVMPLPSPRPAPAASRTGDLLASPALRQLFAANTCAGLCLGALTVGLPARTAEHGAAADSGWLFACLALGSAVAGARFGTRRYSISPATTYAFSFAWLALALTPLAVVSAPLPSQFLLVTAGAALAPMTICLFELLDAHAPRGTAVASMMWMVAGEELGIAAGSVTGGMLADGFGAWLSLLTAAASSGVGALTVATGRGGLASIDR